MTGLAGWIGNTDSVHNININDTTRAEGNRGLKYMTNNDNDWRQVRAQLNLV